MNTIVFNDIESANVFIIAYTSRVYISFVYAEHGNFIVFKETNLLRPPNWLAIVIWGDYFRILIDRKKHVPSTGGRYMAVVWSGIK